jgi:molybdopterin/thiamine biosynthesis adenylyltransferase
MLWRKDADKMLGEFALTLVDPDRFENSNITRHILCSESLGKYKAEEMAKRYPGASFNNTKFGERRFLPAAKWLTPGGCIQVGNPRADRYFSEPPDLVACCADSDACCQLVNQYCVDKKIPCVFGGVHGAAETAEIITYVPGMTPCYACYGREGPEPEPSQEKYTNPEYDSTKMPHQAGLWCDVLMAASMQFRAMLAVREGRPLPLILASLRPPYGAEIVRQKPGCAICSDNMEGLRV